MKIKIILGVSATLAVGVLLSSCLGPPNGQITHTPISSPEAAAPFSIASPSPVISASLAPTADAVIATPATTTNAATPSPSASPAIPSDAKLKVECLDIASNLTAGQSHQGVIVLRDMPNGQLIAVNAATQASTPLVVKDSDNLLDPVVSPSGKSLAYNHVRYDGQGSIIAEELEVVAANGAVQAKVPWQADWVSIAGWLDEDRLVIGFIKGHVGFENDVISLLVVNPFTGRQESLKAAPPDIYDINPIPHWEGWGPHVYDPTLTQAAYLQLVDGIYWAYALWDSKSAQTLVSVEMVDNERRPVWSPTGQQFVLAGSPIENLAWLKFELYAFDRTGEISKLTNLAAYYPTTYIQSYSWSADGRQIAFWLNADIQPDQDQQYGPQNLAVLDTQTLQVTNYCIPGDFSTSRATLVSAPIWSPDGRQLIVENRYAEKTSRVILVDIAGKFAAQISDNMEPIGWMTSDP